MFHKIGVCAFMIKHVHLIQCRFFFKCGRMFYWWYVVLCTQILMCFMRLCCAILPIIVAWLHFTSLCCGWFYKNFIVGKVFLIGSAASFGVRFRRINSWPNWLSSLQNLKFGKLVCFLLVTITSLQPSHFALKDHALQLYKSLSCRAVWR